MTNQIIYNIYINYPTRTTTRDNGVTLNCRSENIKSFAQRHQAVNYCKNYVKKLKPKDVLYIYENVKGKENGIYYFTATANGKM